MSSPVENPKGKALGSKDGIEIVDGDSFATSLLRLSLLVVVVVVVVVGVVVVVVVIRRSA